MEWSIASSVGWNKIVSYSIKNGIWRKIWPFPGNHRIESFTIQFSDVSLTLNCCYPHDCSKPWNVYIDFVLWFFSLAFHTGYVKLSCISARNEKHAHCILVHRQGNCLYNMCLHFLAMYTYTEHTIPYEITLSLKWNVSFATLNRSRIVGCLANIADISYAVRFFDCVQTESLFEWATKRLLYYKTAIAVLPHAMTHSKFGYNRNKSVWTVGESEIAKLNEQ